MMLNKTKSILILEIKCNDEFLYSITNKKECKAGGYEEEAEMECQKLIFLFGYSGTTKHSGGLDSNGRRCRLEGDGKRTEVGGTQKNLFINFFHFFPFFVSIKIKKKKR